MVRFMQAVEEVMHVDRRQIDGRGIGLVLEGVDLRENFRQLAARGAEVHLHRVVVEQPSACFRLPDRNDEGHVAASAEQVIAGFAPRLPARLDQGPVRDETPHNERRTRAFQTSVESVPADSLFGDPRRAID